MSYTPNSKLPLYIDVDDHLHKDFKIDFVAGRGWYVCMTDHNLKVRNSITGGYLTTHGKLRGRASNPDCWWITEESAREFCKSLNIKLIN